MSGGPAEPVPPEAMRGASDWDDEDLLTVSEASERLAREISVSRRRIRQVEEALAGDVPSVVGAGSAADLASERKRLEELVRAVERIMSARADAPR